MGVIPTRMFPLGVGHGAPLPYDAEVEYIQSDGTQYIDTGIAPGNNEIEWEFSFDNTRPSSGSDGLFGSRQTTTAYTSGSYNIFAQSTNLRLDCTSRGSAVYVNPQNPVLLQFDSAYTTVNGTQCYNGTKGQCDYPICIFAINTGGTVTSSGSRAKGKIYYCKIWKSGVLVRDLIPVRVGTAGYLYDSVSAALFGSGDFSVGPDKT